MKVTVNRQFAGANISQDSDAFPVNSREANTKVLVKNGETAVIGGIYQSDAQNGETGVPWFKDVPVVGYLFKSKDTRKQKSELLIFLTPRIMGQLEVPNHDGESPVL
ncbi:Type IV pilus biogenesis and competence protein PilQ precursor [compost metagenome]